MKRTYIRNLTFIIIKNTSINIPVDTEQTFKVQIWSHALLRVNAAYCMSSPAEIEAI